jgi:hypothetical protein
MRRAHDESCGPDAPLRRARLTAPFVAAALVAVVLGGGAGPLPRAAAVAGSGADYAVESLGDPWDYANADDQRIVEGQTSVGILNSRISGGQLRFDINGPAYFHPLWGGYPDTQPVNRDGALRPIDTGRYTRLVMKVTASRYTPAGLRWYTCVAQNASCEGGRAVTLEEGTRVYDVPLAADGTGGAVPWAGSAPISLRILFSPYGPTQIDVDWIRLTGGTGPVDEWNGPVPVIDDPDVTGGADYSTLVRGKPWDFTTADDLLRLDNAVGGIENGQLVATNSGPVTNDPAVTLRVPQAFLGDQFHRITVRWTYEGAFNLEDKVGGGMNARLMWRIAGTPLRPDGLHNEVSRDVTTFPGEDRFTIDLKTNPSSAAVDPRHPSPKIGWAGQRIEMLRFDPNEDRGPRRWRVDDVKLAGDDAAESSFDIQLRDANPAPGTTATVFADGDRIGFDGQVVADGVDLSSGRATVTWRPPAGTRGTYWIHVTMRRGGAEARTYSGGPVRMGDPVGVSSYQFGPAVGGPNSQVLAAAPTTMAMSTAGGGRPVTGTAASTKTGTAASTKTGTATGKARPAKVTTRSPSRSASPVVAAKR